MTHTTDPNDIFEKVARISGHEIPAAEQTPDVRRVLEALEERTSTNMLTGLPNKKALNELLEKELGRIKGASTDGQDANPKNRASDYTPHDKRKHPYRESPSTYVAIDLDGFKAVNDTYGHAAGDAALKFFATTLRNSLRKSDIAIHMSGDEFGAVIRADEEMAQRVMKRMRSALHHSPFTYEGTTIPLSFSMGCHEITAADQDIEAINKDADDKAYEDKKGKPARLSEAQAFCNRPQRRTKSFAERVADEPEPTRGRGGSGPSRSTPRRGDPDNAA